MSNTHLERANGTWVAPLENTRPLAPQPAEPVEPVEPAAHAVEDAEVVLVDQPHHPEPGNLVAELAERRRTRRPIIPVWLRSRRDAVRVITWEVEHAAYLVGYHASRTHLYAWRLTRHAPAGAWKLTRGIAAWVSDAPGRAAIAEALAQKRPGEVAMLSERHDARVKSRVLTLLGAAVVLAVAGILVAQTPTPVQWATVAALTFVLGAIGRPADRKVFDRPVIPQRVERLTSDIVVRALGSLGISELTKAAASNGIEFVAPITRDGPGWRAEINLPYGVTVSDVLERREKLASGLRRPLGCVWPEPVSEEHPGRLVLWVGDVEMRKARQPAWPLAKTGQVDLFQPVPYGLDQRGQWVPITLMYASVIIGAIPRMGKTFLLRLLCLIAALDPRAELHLYDLKGTGDLSPLECVAHRYRAGDDEDDIEYAIADMRALREEMRRRTRVIRDLPKDICPENKITPQLASNRSLGLHPVVIAVDECQRWFEHPEYGEELTEICTDLVKRGPALGIILMLATQRPDAKSIPTGISANAVLRLCLKVMGHVENDMVLGSGAYKAGVRATMFSRKDLGIHYLAGEGDDPRIVRSVYIDAPTAERIAERARALREAAGTLSGHALGETPGLVQQHARVDLLEDILAVTSADEVKIWNSTVVDRLAELRPETYGQWATLSDEEKTAALTARLKEHGVEVLQVWGTTPDGKGANRRGFARADVVEAYTRRKRQKGARSSG